MSDAFVTELERVYRENQYLTLPVRQEMEQRALQQLPLDPEFPTSSRLQALLGRALWGRVTYGDEEGMLARFPTLPLYPKEAELQRLHAQALGSASARQPATEQGLAWAREIASLPAFQHDEAIRICLARALCICAEAAAALSRGHYPALPTVEQFERLAQADALSEEIMQIPGFSDSAEMQYHYGEAVFALAKGWREAVDSRLPKVHQHHRKADGMARRIQGLSQLEREGGEKLLARWAPDLARFDSAILTRLPEVPGFATSGALQNHYSGYLSGAACRAFTADEAYERAEQIRQLPLFHQWPSIMQAYSLALGRVLSLAQDPELILRVTRLLEESAAANPGPALKGWDLLVKLEPDNQTFQTGRREWLARHGFPAEVSLSQVLAARLRPVG